MMLMLKQRRIIVVAVADSDMGRCVVAVHDDDDTSAETIGVNRIEHCDIWYALAHCVLFYLIDLVSGVARHALLSTMLLSVIGQNPSKGWFIGQI